jgi:hypothetical protein
MNIQQPTTNIQRQLAPVRRGKNAGWVFNVCWMLETT